MNQNDKLYKNGPIVIGGLGGSGTRVAAEILSIFGYFIGNDLNNALDNTTFTFLFKKPGWLKNIYSDGDKLKIGLSIFEKALFSNNNFSFAEKIFLFKSAILISLDNPNQIKKNSIGWALDRFNNIIKGKSGVTLNCHEYKGWGWKEPNTHLIFDSILNYFPNSKYIHVLRHGLDMAFSNNQMQLYNWAPLFGIDLPISKIEEPKLALRYWVETTKSVLSRGQMFMPNRVMIVNFDDLCMNPRTNLISMIDFLNIEVSKHQLMIALDIPQIPDSAMRYTKYDISGFEKRDLQYLESMGFKI